MHIALIGAGAMGEAIISSIVSQQVAPPEQIIAAEPRAERREELTARYGITTTAENQEAAHQSEVVILAIKPQMLSTVMNHLRGILDGNTLLISILAGMPISTFVEGLAHGAVVRAMPNTPAQIGEGMTVWTAAPDVNAQQREQARAILSALGRELFVETEQYLDMATAINGSGPAYVFLIMEAMVDAGVHLGFTRATAQELVLQTVLGSARYAMQSSKHLAELRNNVTSPGGTTAAGLNALMHGGLPSTLNDAIWAAYLRSRELGK
jgi:pyrroline-5-carboxylate reductase